VGHGRSGSVRGLTLIAAGVLWVLALLLMVFVTEHQGYGIVFGLPFPPNAKNVISFVLTMLLFLGWLPTLAVGTYRIARKH
jgi:hypothetical protein